MDTMSDKLKRFIGQKCEFDSWNHVSYSPDAPSRLNFANSGGRAILEEVGQDYVVVKTHKGTRQLMHLSNVEVIFSIIFKRE